MAKQKKRRSTATTKKKKVASRSTKKKKQKKAVKGELAFSMNSPLRTYEYLEKEIEKTLSALRKDVKKRDPAAIQRQRDNLLFLLGECDYMAQECTRCIQES